MTLSLGTSPA
ncbi:hypothetical protein Zm00014a_028163 [Zea mays]|uniref:Uncharacterized protein n=1 Tax=Zea mays TaxID=4577 RepID=A0A3L6G7C4_MAIZE|nr:hypothetical protein Zm00014a_028163 [Zea mays]